LIVGFLWFFQKEIKLNSSDIPFRSVRELFPQWPSKNSPWVDWNTLVLVGNFSWQSIEKLLLQEGEKIVLKVTDTLVNQGVFSVISNLGSLVARFFFQPVEEISFTVFSKLLSRNPNSNPTEEKKHAQDCFEIFSMLLKFMLLIGQKCPHLLFLLEYLV
jgi:oligosaccharide translocation protein RFT1